MAEPKKKKSVVDYFSDAYAEAAKSGKLGAKAQVTWQAKEDEKKKKKK